jgi:hypothetical protein
MESSSQETHMSSSQPGLCSEVSRVTCPLILGSIMTTNKTIGKEFFVRPNEFIPERWTSRRELVLDKRAFHPFNVGPYNCVGRHIALRLIRLLLANTLWHYEFKFAPGEHGVDIHEKAVNQLILKAGPLYCVFEKRDAESPIDQHGL